MKNCSDSAIADARRRTFIVADEVTRRSFEDEGKSASSRQRLRGSASLRRRLLSFLVFLFILNATTGRAQSFTNSATLTASIDGTNLVIAYSLSNTQGWVTLFQADRPETLFTQSQPVELARAPVSGLGEFRIPINPGAPTKFYRLLVEQWLSRGKALVFVNGPVDFAAMRQMYGDITNLSVVAYTNQFGGKEYTNQTTPIIFKAPVEVCLEHL